MPWYRTNFDHHSVFSRSISTMLPVTEAEELLFISTTAAWIDYAVGRRLAFARLSSGRSLRSAPLPPCSSPRVRPVLRLSPKNTHIMRSSFDSEVSKLQRFSVGMTDRVKTSCACNFAGKFGKFSWQHGGMQIERDVMTINNQ